MATIETGSIVSDIRGSVGNEVYSRGPGGLYVKSRTSPTQTASAYRDATQATFTALIQAWSGTLTEAQRQTWRQYSAIWLLPNRLGRQVRIPAHCHFVRSNFYPHLTTALVPYLTAPPGGPTHIPQFVFAQHDTDTYDATGTATPDCTGNYVDTGTHNNHPYYRRTDGSFFLWKNNTQTHYIISAILGSSDNEYWYTSGDPPGTYTPYNGATGNPVVTTGAPIISVDVTLPPTTYTPLPDELDLYLSIGKQVNLGRNYYSTPWRYSDWNHWNGSIWTKDPWNVPTPWTVTANHKLFARMVAILAGGETSGHFQCNIMIT